MAPSATTNRDNSDKCSIRAISSGIKECRSDAAVVLMRVKRMLRFYWMLIDLFKTSVPRSEGLWQLI
jgi:hypothetical protein